MAFGDHIQFIRYIPFLIENFNLVKVFVYPQLLDLFKNSFKEYSKLEFIVISDNFPEYDYSIALSKLPYYLDMDFENIPYSEGYLVADDKKNNSDKLKIGICWEAGNSDLRSTIHRTINIKEFSIILEKDDFDFYSFQVGASTKDYLKYKNLKDLGKDFKNFNDTANELKQLDILISVDTSVANLAGALGVKTFMLLPYYSDWRWFNNTETTEWYDSIKIFKQTKKDSWSSEIEQVLAELTKLSNKC